MTRPFKETNAGEKRRGPVRGLNRHNAAKEKNTICRKFIASFLPLLVAACASVAKPTRTVNVPDKLKPGANESLAMIIPANGVQIYECREKKDQAGAYEWAFVAPEADLFDTGGKKIGKHYAGPHWESNDGSITNINVYVNNQQIC